MSGFLVGVIMISVIAIPYWLLDLIVNRKKKKNATTSTRFYKTRRY